MKALPEPDGIPVRDEPVNPAFVEVRIVDGTNPVTFIIVEAIVIVPAVPSLAVHPVHSVHRWTKWTERVRPMPMIRADGALFQRQGRCQGR